mgnify:FL=1
MGEQQDVALRRVIVAVLVVLNISVVCFYALWEVADTIAVNRVEEHGFDPQQLLPHNILFWLAAQASLLSLLALDVLAIVAWRRRWRWQKPQTTPPSTLRLSHQCAEPHSHIWV